MAVVHPESLAAGDHGPSATGSPHESRRTCALVNNMPDGAFKVTERQFLGLLGAGLGGDTLDVRLYALDSIPRGKRVAQRIAEHYAPVADLVADPPDVLIVTGANPVEPVLQDEPFWSDLVELLSWATEHTRSVLLSCLSAHAALAVFDGLERERLARKCTGVFRHEVESDDPLTDGLDADLTLPHSRLNSVPTRRVRDAGYEVPVFSRAVGWGVATRRIGRAEVVLVQAHPEYGPTSLLREYHRDVRRYVLGERDDLPILPLRCVAPGDRSSLAELHHRITHGEREPALVAAYPFEQVGARVPWPWREAAGRLYANWLAGAMERSG